MAEYRSLLLYMLITYVSALQASQLCSANDEYRKVYIVYMGSLPEGEYRPSSHHLSLLQDVIGDRFSENFFIRSYKRSFNGFAAKLTNEEAQKLALRKEVVSIFPSRTFQLQTTRSWDFMGLRATTKENLSSQSDIIVGVIDTGIWPESESFNDEGFGSPPKKWKGACKGGRNFTCNKKIIGARYYYSSSSKIMSARDDLGHGTHTASIVAGNLVKDASFYGVAQGTARGGVPSARIAAYKVCNAKSCESGSILGAFDDAIADGIDVISISIGGASASSFEEDVIAISAFHAMRKGIVTLQSAGNEGPREGTVTSVAPWILSVAASTTDRQIIDKVVLGNGKELVVHKWTKFPLIYGKNASSTCIDIIARACIVNCLDSRLVKGKIVLCDLAEGYEEAKRAGAVGSIMESTILDSSYVFPLPASLLASDTYRAVKSYMNSTEKPSATILKSESIKDASAPVVPFFSSRGPNPIIPAIMKPDVSAPGVDILAAYVPVVPPSGNPEDKRRTKYSILSGTSMSCPHAAGVAAYVKASHPDWSPSAIQSAIITTAWPMNATTNSEAEFAYGSGHVNPVKAIHPGLVFDASEGDYIQLLCGMGYDAEKLRRISGDNSSCSNRAGKTLAAKDFNYPSIAVKVPPGKSFTIGFHRTVTNVGIANSTYKAEIVWNSKLEMKVVPEVLSFQDLKEKKSFDVSIAGRSLSKGTIVSASLVWSDGSHNVRSPIVVYTAKI